MPPSLLEGFSPNARGAIYVTGLYAATFALHVLLPPWSGTAGYARDCRTGDPLEYRYNGLFVLVVVIVGLLFTASADDLADLAVCFWPMVYTSNCLGLAISGALYVRGQSRLRRGLVDRGVSCLVVGVAKRSKTAAATDEFEARGPAENFYCGIEWNPRVLGIDIKMFNYLVGAVALACNLLGAMALHLVKTKGAGGINGEAGADPVTVLELTSSCSNAMCAYTVSMAWFIIEYMYHEHVHVYTYDIFRERVGAKMCWGCWCFYPFFYCVGVWPLVASSADKYQNGDLSFVGTCGCVSMFFAGWVLTRFANLQKFYFRTEKSPTFLCGVIQNVTVPGSNGRLLCSGFWGVSRHVNYLGEILQGCALALPAWLATGSMLPWLYPFYYVMLFVPRDLDDDEVCAKKYGKSWDKYRTLVPYRIVPGLY